MYLLIWPWWLKIKTKNKTYLCMKLDKVCNNLKQFVLIITHGPPVVASKSDINIFLFFVWSLLIVSLQPNRNRKVYRLLKLFITRGFSDRGDHQKTCSRIPSFEPRSEKAWNGFSFFYAEGRCVSPHRPVSAIIQNFPSWYRLMRFSGIRASVNSTDIPKSYTREVHIIWIWGPKKVWWIQA